MIQITRLTPTLVDICQREFGKIGWTKPDGYFVTCLEQQIRGEIVFYVARDVCVAGAAGRYVGHVKLVWTPDYVHFREAGIPEIQDLNVLPDYRKQGVGTRLIQSCETLARTRCDYVGIGVGLYAGYNAAQRLYTKLGYSLDGHGVHYDGVPVEAGQSYCFDDELIIYFTKLLNKP